MDIKIKYRLGTWDKLEDFIKTFLDIHTSIDKQYISESEKDLLVALMVQGKWNEEDDYSIRSLYGVDIQFWCDKFNWNLTKFNFIKRQLRLKGFVDKKHIIKPVYRELGLYLIKCFEARNMSGEQIRFVVHEKA